MDKEVLKISIIEQFKNEHSPIRAIMLKTYEAETTLENSSFLKHKCFQAWDHGLRIDVNTIKNKHEYAFQISFSEAEYDGYPEECDELNQYNGIIYYREHFRIKGDSLSFRLKKCLLSQENYSFALDMKSQKAKTIKGEDFFCVYNCDTGELSGDLNPNEFYLAAMNARQMSIRNSGESGVVPYMDFGFNKELLKKLKAMSISCKNKEASIYLKKTVSLFENTNGLPMPGESVSPMLFLMIDLFSKVRT